MIDKIDMEGTIAELKDTIFKLQKVIEMRARSENYEEASKLKKTIESIQLRIKGEKDA